MDKYHIEAYLRTLTPLPTHMKQRGRLRFPIQCLMCDLYGTLFISGSGDISTSTLSNHQASQVDSLLSRHQLSVSASELFAQLHQAITEQHIQAKQKGMQFPEVAIESIWQQLLPNLDPNRIKQFAIEFEMITNPTWPMPGMRRLLSACVHSQRLLGIISNAQFFTPFLFEWLVEDEAAALGFDPELSIYSFHLGEAKPSRRLFALACDRLQKKDIEPSAVAFIGNDMRNDIVPAHNAGFQTILFAGDQRSLRLHEDDPRCRTIQPDMVITHLDQLTSHLRQGSLAISCD